MLAPSGGGLILFQAYDNLYAMTGSGKLAFVCIAVDMSRENIYPFDYRVTLGFSSIAGGLDPVSLVIRLPIERGINSGTRIGFRSCTSRSHYQSVSKQTTRSWEWCGGGGVEGKTGESGVKGMAGKPVRSA
nr:hypothetical protein [Tanacetum cinerariifolium]